MKKEIPEEYDGQMAEHEHRKQIQDTTKTSYLRSLRGASPLGEEV